MLHLKTKKTNQGTENPPRLTYCAFSLGLRWLPTTFRLVRAYIAGHEDAHTQEITVASLYLIRRFDEQTKAQKAQGHLGTMASNFTSSTFWSSSGFTNNWSDESKDQHIQHPVQYFCSLKGGHSLEWLLFTMNINLKQLCYDAKGAAGYRLDTWETVAVLHTCVSPCLHLVGSLLSIVSTQ